jgi:hypothetical protein
VIAQVRLTRTWLQRIFSPVCRIGRVVLPPVENLFLGVVKHNSVVNCILFSFYVLKLLIPCDDRFGSGPVPPIDALRFTTDGSVANLRIGLATQTNYPVFFAIDFWLDIGHQTAFRECVRGKPARNAQTAKIQN